VVANWFWAFVFTQAFEVPIYLVALRRRVDRAGQPLPRESLRWRLGFAFLASMATHPYVWFVIPTLFSSRPWVAAVARWPGLQPWRHELFFVTAESFAVLAEALLLRALRVPSPLLWALVANATSAGLGLLARAYGIWL
jgi:hypothetical protein